MRLRMRGDSREGLLFGGQMFVSCYSTEVIMEADSYASCFQADRQGYAFNSKAAGPWWRLLDEIVLVTEEMDA